MTPVRPPTWAKEIIAFGGVGALAFVTQVGLLNLFVHGGVGPLSANAIAIVVSALVGYLGNRYVSFAHRASTRRAREAAIFVLVNAATFVLAESLLATSYLFGAQHDHATINVLNLLGIAVGTLVRFYVYRRFVFPSRVETTDHCLDSGPSRRVLVGPGRDGTATRSSIPQLYAAAPAGPRMYDEQHRPEDPARR